MPVREILQQFVDRCTRIDVRARSGDVIVPNAPADVYGPGVGPSHGVGMYVDTGEHRVGGANDRLWTDSASWCTIVASHDGHNRTSYLAHISPGQSHVAPAVSMKQYSAAAPGNLTLCTMEVHLQNTLGSEPGARNSSLWSVVKMLDMNYSAARNGADRGAMAVAANTRIVTGYCGMQWDQSCSVATETYGVFLMSPARELRL